MRSHRYGALIFVVWFSLARGPFVTWTDVHAQGAFVWTTYTEIKPVLCLAVDGEDGIWAGTTAGISRFDGVRWRRYTRVDGLPSDVVRDVCIDREGNVWIATGNGAARFDGWKWTTFTIEDGLVSNTVNAIAEDREGNIWFGQQRGATQFDGVDWITYDDLDKLASTYVRSFAADTSGGMWFGTLGGATWSDGTEWKIYTKEEGLMHDIVQCVAVDAFGSVWFGTPAGISRFGEGKWIGYGPEHGLIDANVLSLFVDDGGSLWAGTSKGVNRFDGRTWTTYTQQDGLGEGKVRAILQDGTGTFWFGTQGGVTSLKRHTGGGTFVYTFGRGGHAWEEMGEGTDLDFDAEPDVLVPRKPTPMDNLAARALERGGRIWSSSSDDDPKELERLIDEDLLSGYERPMIGTRTVYIDLGKTFPIGIIEVHPARGESPSREDLLSQMMAVSLSDQDPQEVKLGGGVPELRMCWNRPIDGFSPVQVDVPPDRVYARYVAVEVSKTEHLRLFEIKVYGLDRYMPTGSYMSDVIDLWGIAGWGKLWWGGEKPPDAEVLIRTRSGTDEDPNVYWRYIAGRQDQTSLTPEGVPLTWEDHQELEDHLKGQITWDEKNWSSWSAPYSWEEGREGAGIVSPGPRRYFQVRVDFVNTADQAGKLAYLSIEYSQPPSAHRVYGEIFPTEVKAAARTTFTYAVRPRIGGDDTGFDSLEILTPVPVDAVRSVKIDGREVSFTVEVLEDPPRFIVHFPGDRMDVSDDNGVLEVTFDCVVYQYGTAFEGRVFDSRLGQAHQRVMPGDAKERFHDDEIAVRIDLSAPLIAFVHTSPDPFSPNGDGINDEVTVFYAVSKVTQPISVEIVLYDLSGTRVRKGYAGEGGIGPYTWRWDGRDDRGELLPPGVYVYRISIYPDIGLSARTGTVHMVY